MQSSLIRHRLNKSLHQLTALIEEAEEFHKTIAVNNQQIANIRQSLTTSQGEDYKNLLSNLKIEEAKNRTLVENLNKLGQRRKELFLDFLLYVFVYFVQDNNSI